MPRFIVRTACLLTALFIALHGATALEYRGIGGRPANPDPAVPNSASWFIYSLPPGSAKADAVLIENSGTVPVELVVYAADSTPSSDGGFALKQRSEQQTNVGSWVRFYPTTPPEPYARDARNIIELCAFANDPPANQPVPKNIEELRQWCQGTLEVNLQTEPGSTQTLAFVIRVLDNAETGEHSGGIMLEKRLPENPSPSQSGLALTTRVGVRIYQTVPGTVVRQLAISRFSVAKNRSLPELTVTIGVRNSGNVSVDHRTNLTIENLLLPGRSQTLTRDGQALPNQELVTNIALPYPRFGRFSYQAQVNYTATDGTDQTLTTPRIVRWFVPWIELAAFAALIVVALAVWKGWGWLQRRKLAAERWRPYRIKPGDDILVLAERTGIRWRAIVRRNQLRPPYRLKPGADILLPTRLASPKPKSRAN